METFYIAPDSDRRKVTNITSFLVLALTAAASYFLYTEIIVDVDSTADKKTQIAYLGGLSLASVSGILAVHFPCSALSSLRFVFFGATIGFIGGEDCPFTLFDLKKAFENDSLKAILGFSSAYVALLLNAVVLGCLCKVDSRIKVRSSSVQWFVVVFTLGVAGIVVLLKNVDNTLEDSQNRIIVNAIAAPTILNLIVLVGGACFKNSYNCYVSLLLVALQCFWILPKYLTLASDGQTLNVMNGSILCWVSAVISKLSSSLFLGKFPVPDPLNGPCVVWSTLCL
jgi:hypothetical protein